MCFLRSSIPGLPIRIACTGIIYLAEEKKLHSANSQSQYLQIHWAWKSGKDRETNEQKNKLNMGKKETASFLILRLAVVNTSRDLSKFCNTFKLLTFVQLYE